ncbi:deoxyribodipyrimidine photo-lyase [Bacillus sp. 31A1R]|uniref:Deoxyribodipyrimidine photo-lyase n=1 Tax=Robertmurraya mangrovi TaxID=3098077 RepID=A0ABU5ISM3_9BACI|nr:deoxyribodipyrimidine photo-lyase [Bacillus sp. 31A1R]MDZ5470153.1 deoxyribodipyrimidine photo-lyase [Bacillus sp. 31A1R]
MKEHDRVIYIMRKDFRIHDNPALFEASKHKNTYILYIYDPIRERIGSAKKWWLHHALVDIKQKLGKLNGKLIIKKGCYEQEIKSFIKETEAHTIYWNRIYDPYTYNRDIILANELSQKGINIKTYEGTLLLPPWTIKNSKNEPYKVFTPFYKQFFRENIPKCVPSIQKIYHETDREIVSLDVSDLNLLPTIPWTRGFHVFDPTEDKALKMAEVFIKNNLSLYKQHRDYPYLEGCSTLSPYISFGQLSVRRLWHQINQFDHDFISSEFLRQLVWREFTYHTLMTEPHMEHEPLNSKFLSFQWEDDDFLYKQWCRGRTGYPIVDAGMRELWETGMMHNRVRMITASFLTKHLLMDWRKGATWFFDTLLDADVANNSFGWQWVAGTGRDASPYFRIFNPMLQSKKFDPKGEYIKKWIPELTLLPERYVHEPWTAPSSLLKDAGIELEKDYPLPIIDHHTARARALNRYNEIK